MIYLALGLFVGLLIGAVGVGGVLLAPLLALLAGMDLHLALATASFSFLFAGLAGVAAYAGRGSIPWPAVRWLTLGVVPAALLGARLNTLLTTSTLSLILGTLVALAGLNALLLRGKEDGPQTEAGGALLAGLGGVTGFVSALTGTGGPVTWLPLASMLRFPTLAALGASQAIQLPIALFAATGFALFGQVDWGAGVILGLGQAVGIFAGAALAHRLPASRLRQVVALALVGAGLLLLGKNIP